MTTTPTFGLAVLFPSVLFNCFGLEVVSYVGVTNFSNKKYMNDVYLRVCLFPSHPVPSTIIFATIQIARVVCLLRNWDRDLGECYRT